MSLTVTQWLRMWENVKSIEKVLNTLPMNKQTRKSLAEKLADIKIQIQSVIGQLE